MLAGRSTRYLLLRACPAAAVPAASMPPCGRRSRPCPARLSRTFTWDQGKEIAHHAQFTIDTGIKVYFCDMHKPPAPTVERTT